MTYDRELRTEAAHALTHNQEVWSDRGYAVVTAGGLSEGDTDFELDVGPYDVLVGDTDTVSVGPTTLSVNAPDSDPYWLAVYVDGEGLQTEQGPEGEVFVGDQSVVASNADVREITSPAPPTLADIGPVTVLGKALVTSSGVSNSLIDDRVFQSERVFESVDANEVSAERASIGEVVAIIANDAVEHDLNDNAFTQLQYDTTVIEDSQIASVDLSNDSITVNEGGTYAIQINLRVSSSSNWSTGDRIIPRPEVNFGSSTSELANGVKVSTERQSFVTPVAVDKLSEGDVVTAHMFQNSGETQSLNAGDRANNLIVWRCG